MTRILSSKQIVERAARMGGIFPITETGMSAEELEEALYWLDMMVGHTSGVNRLYWLVPDTAPITLVAGQQDYQLPAALAPNAPAGVQFPIEAILVRPGGSRATLSLVSRFEFEEHSDLDTAVGEPVEVYIDRMTEPKLRTYPTLDSSVTDTYQIELVFQTFSPDLTLKKGQNSHNFRVAWNLWLCTNLAYWLTGGVLGKRMPQGERDALKKDAGELLAQLTARENREHTGYPRTTAPQDF